MPWCVGLADDDFTNLDCDFDTDTCIWNASVGSHSWTRWSGSTVTSDTGPSIDHTSGSGSYLYVESSYPNSPGVGSFYCQARVSTGGLAFINYAYSMYGANMGTLTFETSDDDGLSWTERWKKSGNQGRRWQKASVDLTFSSPTQVRFVGTTGAGATSDMAIDDIVGSGTNLPTPLPTVTFGVSNQDELLEAVVSGAEDQMSANVALTHFVDTYPFGSHKHNN